MMDCLMEGGGGVDNRGREVSFPTIFPFLYSAFAKSWVCIETRIKRVWHFLTLFWVLFFKIINYIELRKYESHVVKRFVYAHVLIISTNERNEFMRRAKN